MAEDVIWRVRLICCGRDDGDIFRSTWQEADQFRQSYTSGTGVRHFDGRGWRSGHDRAGIIEQIGGVSVVP
jgi:hypothetical protein